jgi:hypothetical protein
MKESQHYLIKGTARYSRSQPVKSDKTWIEQDSCHYLMQLQSLLAALLLLLLLRGCCLSGAVLHCSQANTSGKSCSRGDATSKHLLQHNTAQHNSPRSPCQVLSLLLKSFVQCLVVIAAAAALVITAVCILTV